MELRFESISGDNCHWSIKHTILNSFNMVMSFYMIISMHLIILFSQFNLVCDRSYYASLTQSAYMVGYIFSGILLAHMSDKYGRKPIAWLSMILELITTLCTALASNYWIYLISRFLLGFASLGEWMSLEILRERNNFSVEIKLL